MVERAALGLFTVVQSVEIRDEVTGVLGRPSAGNMTVQEVEQRLATLWNTSLWVELAPDDDAYRRAMARDASDSPVLRTAMGLYLAGLNPVGSEVFVVTENTKHFPRRFGEIRIVDALRFLRALGST